MELFGLNIWLLLFLVLAVIAGFILAKLLLLVIFQSKMVFMPTQEIVSSPKDIGLEYEDITFPASDLVNLHGWFIPSDKERGVLLFCHGNHGNISYRLESIALFNRLGLSVFIFDYRGYGQSEGSPSEKGIYIDASSAWKYLTRTRKIKSDKIIVFGRSLGGAVAVNLANDIYPGALIVESSFTSAVDMAKIMYPYLPVSPIVRFKLNSIEKILNINCPVLVIHSPEDDIIPYWMGKKIYENAPQPKTFLEIEGDHNEGFLTSGEKYTSGIKQFLSKHL